MASTAWRTASLAVSMISSRRNWGTKPRSSGRRTEGTTEDEEGGTDIVLANAEGRDGRNAKRVGGYLEMNTATAREVAREKN